LELVELEELAQEHFPLTDLTQFSTQSLQQVVATAQEYLARVELAGSLQLLVAQVVVEVLRVQELALVELELLIKVSQEVAQQIALVQVVVVLVRLATLTD
jgi:hypothetical protein